MKPAWTILALFFAITSAFADVSFAQSPVQPAGKYSQTQIANPAAGIFQDFSEKSVVLTAPFTDLFSMRSNDTLLSGDKSVTKREISGTITIDSFNLPVKLRMRGGQTLVDCRFPKMTLRFDKTTLNGTPFEGIKDIDLGTHCDAAADQADLAQMPFNHREALFYKWLQILDIPGYSARPLNVTYRDTSASAAKAGSPVVTQAQGFFLETLASFLARSHGIEIRSVDDVHHRDQVATAKRKIEYQSIKSSPNLDLVDTARIALFEAFIGNWDWDLNDQSIDNLKLVELPSGSWLPIPQDFNSACMISGQGCADLFWPRDMTLGSIGSTFDLVNKSRQIAIINEFESLRTELESSLAALSDDPAGLKIYQSQLNLKFEDLETLKKSINTAQ